MSSSLSSSQITTTDFPDSLYPSVPIIHHSQRVFKTSFCVPAGLK